MRSAAQDDPDGTGDGWELVLGTRQQVVAINLANRERVRELVAVIVGSGGVASPPAFLCGFQYLSST